MSMKVLYYCAKCETPLTDADRRSSGLEAKNSADLKRYCGVVIDGTSCGILADLPDYHRDNFKLTASKGTGRKFLFSSRSEKKTLKTFFDLANTTFAG